MKRLLLAVLLFAATSAFAQPIIRNGFTTNTFTGVAVPIIDALGNVAGLATTSTNAFLKKQGATVVWSTNLEAQDVIVNNLTINTNLFFVSGKGNTLVITQALTLQFLKTNLLATDANGLVTTTKFGAGISWDPATQTLSSSGGDTIWTNSNDYTRLVAPGDFFSFGDSTLDVSNFSGTTASVFAIGTTALDATLLNNTSHAFSYGFGTLASSLVTNSSVLFAFGEGSLGSIDATNSTSLFGYGSLGTLGNSVFQDSSFLFGYGAQTFNNVIVTNGSSIYAYGSGALANSFLTNSSDIYAFGDNAGNGLSGTLTHVFLIGSGAAATNSNQFVFGDALYNYSFPGASARFASGVSVSGLTNIIGDNGSTITYNGLPISGDTTATNQVQLVQSGTNLVSQMDFALVARGGIFTLSLTNNCFIGTPVNVNNTDFKKCWLTIRQPSTGTCLVQFTNGSFAFPEGVAPIIDTNANAVTYFEFVSSPWTNGLLEGWMSLKSQRIP